jgi:hypothetical protein
VVQGSTYICPTCGVPLGSVAGTAPAYGRAWLLPHQSGHDGGYTVHDPAKTNWLPPKFTYNADLAAKPELAKVLVVIYNLKLRSQGGKTLIEFLKDSEFRPRRWNSRVMHDSAKGCST